MTPAAHASVRYSLSSNPRDSQTCGGGGGAVSLPRHHGSGCRTARSRRSPPAGRMRPTQSGAARPRPSRAGTAPPRPILCTRARGPCGATRSGTGTSAVRSTSATPQPPGRVERRPSGPSTSSRQRARRTTAAPRTAAAPADAASRGTLTRQELQGRGAMRPRGGLATRLRHHAHRTRAAPRTVTSAFVTGRHGRSTES